MKLQASWYIAFALAGVGVGCTGADPAGEPGDHGVARLALAAVPDGVACLSVTAAGTRTVTRLFPVSPGQPTVLNLTGLPVGNVEFTGAGFAAGCDAVGGTYPAWISDAVIAMVSAEVVAQVGLTLRRPGRARVSIDFADDSSPPGPCPPGRHQVSDGRCLPILFADDFDDGAVSGAWRLWRKTFVESGGRLNVGDLPRPGFNYGPDGNGRNAVLATHVGDVSWTDYRIDLDVASTPAGSFNPYGLRPCERFFSIELRVARAVESWNDPALTAYSIGVYVPRCDGPNINVVGMDSVHDLYRLGPGGANETGVDRGLVGTTSPALVDGPNHYAIEVVGNTIKMWINGNPTFTFTDDKPYPPGSSPITHGGLQLSWYLESLGWVDNVVVTDMR
jgi:hypothetical protein